MKTRRLALAAAATAAVIGLTGCGSQTGSAGGSTTGGTSVTDGAPAAPADPQARFSAAVAELGKEPVKVDIEAIGNVKMSGAIDPKTKKAQLASDMGETGTMEIRQTGDDIYVKIGGKFAELTGNSADKWMRIDTKTLPTDSALNPLNNDPTAVGRMLADAKVTSTGGDSYSGQVDMSKSPSINKAAAATMGDKLKSVPFTAKLAGDRLSEITFDMAAIAQGAGKMTTRYSDYGTPVEITVPSAAETVEMPATFRKSMGG